MRISQITDCLPQTIGLIRMSGLQFLNHCLVMRHLALGGYHVRVAFRQLSLILNGLLPKLRCCLTQTAIDRLLEQLADPPLRLHDRLRPLSHRDHHGAHLLNI